MPAPNVPFEPLTQAEREELSRLRTILRHSPEVITLLDANGNVVFRSPSLAKPLGYEHGLVGQNALEIVHPTDRSRVARALQEVNRERGSETNQLFRVRHADGSWRWLAATATNRLDDPSVGAIVLSYRDVTEQKQVEDDAQLADKIAGLSTLASGVGHEINNPLTAVLLNLDFALGRSVGDDEKLIDALNEAREAARRISAVVRGLRALSRNEAIETHRVDVVAVVERALEASIQVLCDVRVMRELSPVPPASADETILQQVIESLLVNAAEAVSTNGKVLVAVSREGEDWIRIDVADDGHGISEEHLSRIYDPLFTTKQGRGGVGLGLSLAHRAVRDMKGTMRVVSATGEGTTFSICLRRSLERSLEDVGPASPSERRGRVLVVDDDPAVLRVIIRVLEQDFDVVSAPSAREALAVLESDVAWDLVLTDVQMPVMNGIQFYGTLSERWPELGGRVVFITGGANRALDEFVETAGQRCILKPFDADHLRSLVDDYVRELRDAMRVRIPPA